MRFCLLIAVLCLSACQTSGKLPTCSGPIFPLNVGHWQPAPGDLTHLNEGK
ncbi:type IV secretion system protein VirB7 [Phyllobacterium myrsinacearum]|uniref:type IV secretion system lipoprotein VirB7 n=1 Tax=Phyllobacterium myrsinacearum TaxID=28101 RepID=UPI00102A9F4B|nr:type IV secretion system lipoprotein VirB7 [Phyllobacterium myrsinacearum]RZS76866.1 type IV secretion system protein VirB7 [Phyllobacterium myrsinacearum]